MILICCSNTYFNIIIYQIPISNFWFQIFSHIHHILSEISFIDLEAHLLTQSECKPEIEE